jgi:phospholipid/cholesterol/gamma-HCH transport system permease protein
LGLALRPWRLRFTATVRQLELVGLNAVPVVALVSFLIGVVIAYQGATQLQRFGAEVFAVDLLAISVLREVGILLTAVVVAGRSGSAFAAEIGAMKIGEEIDAMRTIGLDPVEVLVLPRTIALVVALPLLGFLADLMGLLGGAVMLNAEIGIGFHEFLARLEVAFAPWSFGVGLVKAPFFAFLIALTGCHMGFRAQRSAEDVGRRTTLSVVYAIFSVIVLDALFSVFFSLIGI